LICTMVNLIAPFIILPLYSKGTIGLLLDYRKIFLKL